MSRIFELEAQSDEALLRAFVGSGDRDALDVLIARHEQRVFNLSFRLLGSRADALDATQDVFLSVFRRAATFKHQSAFTTWLYRLAVNACYDLGRKKSRSPVPVEAEDSVSPDPGHAADLRVDVQSALMFLPPDQRAAVVMRDLYGMSYKEIAEASGVPDGTIKSRIARARIDLAGRLGRRKESDELQPPGALSKTNRSTGKAPVHSQGGVTSPPPPLPSEPPAASDRLTSEEHK